MDWQNHRSVKPIKPWLAAILLLLLAPVSFGETCTTQSQMTPADRSAIVAAANSLAGEIQAGNAEAVRSATIGEVAQDFSGIQEVVNSTAPKLKGGQPQVEQIYLLDSSMVKQGQDGSTPEAQFYCSLNHTVAEVDFVIPSLPPGRYVFAMVDFLNIPSPQRLSFLLRQDQGRWMMAGIYPKALTAGGHDGLWYWRQAREKARQKEPWTAWLYYHEAEALLQPTGFVQSSHLEKLRAEAAGETPPALAKGITADTPLVVPGKNGASYHFSSFGIDDTLGTTPADVEVHLTVDQVGDPATARARNMAAMSALLAAYPELRRSFHGVWVYADAPNQNPFATEQAMANIP